MTEWKSITTAPEKKMVLLCDVYQREILHRIFVGMYRGGKWFAHGYTKHPTHWMRLPEEPR